MQSWKHLKVHNQSELLDPARLKRVLRGRGAGVLSIVIASLMAMILFALSVVLAIYSEFIIAGSLFLLSAACAYGAVHFKKSMDRDTVRNYFKDPTSFEVVSGMMVSNQYVRGDNRASSRMVVRVEVNGITISEEFETDEWPFTTEEEEASLQPGDDWYEDIGKRKKLPVPVYVLCHKQGTYPRAIIGIDAQNLIYGSHATR